MRKFEVGDRVVVVNEAHDLKCRDKSYAGECGVVHKTEADDDSVLVNISEGESWWFGAEELAPTDDPINHPAHYAGSNGLTGGLSNYYLSRVEFPQREDQPPYTAECEDLIESLRLNPDEANIFKEIWRSANARLGNGKPDHKALYGAEKINHYAGRNLRRVKREAGGV